MKNIKLLLLFLCLTILAMQNSYACSCTGGASFCDSYRNYDYAASGVVIDTFSNGISLKVLFTLYGKEIRDTITVWDLGGPYDMCNDSLVAKAKSIGDLNDTIIIALPRIKDIKNSWDIIGDYRNPGFQCDEIKLKVHNNVVSGLISGSEFCHFQDNCLTAYDYDSFINEFLSKGELCDNWVSTDNIDNEIIFEIYPNPTKDIVHINSEYSGTLRIINQYGQVIDEVEIISNVKFRLEGLRSGLYYLVLHSDRKTSTRKMLVK